MPIAAILLVLLAGVGLAVQAPTNAALARTSGSVLLAALVSFIVGSIVLALAWAAIDRTSLAALRGAPVWAWVGGLYGACFVACFVAAMAFAAPRLGLATTLTVAIATQLATAHFGLLGLKVAPISLWKVAGVVLVLAGVVLVRRG